MQKQWSSVRAMFTYNDQCSHTMINVHIHQFVSCHLLSPKLYWSSHKL